MARFGLENRNDGSWFICQPERGETIDTFSVGMLQNNHIKGLPGPVKTEENGRTVLMYPLGKGRPLSELFAEDTDRDMVLGVLEQIAGILQEADQYMLPGDGVLTQPRMMFADPDTREVTLIYVPLNGFSNKLTMKKCLRRLISGAVFREAGDLSYVAHVLNLLNREKEFSPLRFRDGLRSLRERQR